MGESFVTVTQQVAVLAVLIGVGFVCGKARLLNEQAVKGITNVVLYIVNPCVIIASFQREWDAALLVNLLVMAGLALFVHVVAIVAGGLLIRDRDGARRAVLRFGAVFSNCGFMSLPLQQALLGADGVFYGAAFIAVSTLLAWTYGLVSMSGDRRALSARHIVTNPGIIGTSIGLVLFLLSVRLPPLIAQPVDYLAALNTPVPMLIIGFYLAQTRLGQMLRDKGLYLSLLVRLILTPLVTLAVLLLLRVDSTVAVATSVAAAAPAAATTTMFATKFGRDPVLSVNLVSLTTVASLLTMPVMIALTQFLVG